MIQQFFDAMRDLFPESHRENRIKAMAVYFFMIILTAGAMFYTYKADFLDEKLTLLTFAALMGFTLVAPILGYFLGDVMYEKWNFVILLVYPFVCFYMVELGMNTGFSLWYTDFLKILGNYGLYGLVVWGVYALTMSVRAGVFGGAVFSFIFAVGNIYIVRFRSIPVLAGDLSTLQTAMNVSKNYDYTFDVGQVMMLVFLMASLAYVFFFKTTEKHKKNWRMRLAVLACYCVLLSGTSYVVVGTDFLREHGLTINTFSPLKSFRASGGLLIFARSIRNMVIDKPKGYSQDALEAIEKKYPSDSVSAEGSTNRPNIIVVMDEAFADLQGVGEFETNQPVMPYFDSLKGDNVIKTDLYVSSFGGKTANTEFEMISADSVGFLPTGTTPYQLYIKGYMPTMVKNLDLNGYSGILAMHPFGPSGYNRQNVYPWFGFRQFIAEPDYPDDAGRIGGHISDVANFDRIIEEYEKCKKESDEPFYIHNVTMQNHSPYDRKFSKLDYAIKILDSKLRTEEAETYLSLIHESDKALKGLIEYFEKKDEQTVIVFFGDHEPKLSEDFYKGLTGKYQNDMNDKELMNLYHTPLLIWSNKPLNKSKLTGEISINYLQSVLFDICDMKKSGYNKFLIDAHKKVPIINTQGYKGDNGKFYDINDKKSPYYKVVNQYNMLVYNHLFDKNHRMDSFFELKK